MTRSWSDVILAGRRSDDPMQGRADTSSVIALIAWAPKSSLEQGVGKLAAYLKSSAGGA